MSDTTKTFNATLRTGGLSAAIRWLNKHVPYRYSAVFGFDGDTLHNICLIDKENATVSNCPDQPITESYCMYIRRESTRFGVEESLTDRRVDGHPKQRMFQSYGIPLYGENGHILGTVCHFDLAPVPVTDEVASALDELAPLIADAAFKARSAKAKKPEAPSSAPYDDAA